MKSKVLISAEFPTENEVAAWFRLSPARVAELRKQLDDLHIAHSDGSVTIVAFKKRVTGNRR